MGSGADWDAVAPSFEASHHCIAVDLPGHGQSRANTADDCDMVETCTNLMELIDDHGHDSFSVVGYSMGGRIALYLALYYSMRIDKVVAESASLGLRTEAERTQRRADDKARAQRLESESFDDFLRDWYNLPLFQTLHRDPSALSALIERRMTNDPAQLALSLRGVGTGSQPALWEEWPDNHVPTLLIAGEDDAKYAALTGEMSAACPEAEARIIPGCGHNVHYEIPNAYTTALAQFIQKR
jgi:2-succinyl-6-hydroxy-2,4-cyclohexadiene-1-carboxylate synthase